MERVKSRFGGIFTNDSWETQEGLNPLWIDATTFLVEYASDPDNETGRYGVLFYGNEIGYPTLLNVAISRDGMDSVCEYYFCIDTFDYDKPTSPTYNIT